MRLWQSWIGRLPQPSECGAEEKVPNIEDKQVVIRSAVVKDVPTMARIINGYASQGLMLPRSLHNLYQCVRSFIVAASDD